MTSLENPAVKELVRLHDRDGRRESGLALLEGPHLLAEALAAGRRPMQVLFQTGWDGTPAGHALLSAAAGLGVSLVETTARVMAKIATTDTPPPVLATMPLAELPGGRGSIRAGLVLDGLQDPGNVGTILRAAWGAGLDSAWATPGTVDLYAPKVLRAAQGAHFHLSLRVMGVDETVAVASREGWWLVVTEPKAAVPFWRAELRQPCLICIGNEARGIDPALAAVAKEHVSVPLVPGVDSLNAAIGAGVILFELVRRLAMADAAP